MESLKPKVQAVQDCQSALRIPEEVVTSLPMCHSALRLQEEASRLQHTAIQQCNIMQASAAPSRESPGGTWTATYKLQWKCRTSHLWAFLCSVVPLGISPLSLSYSWLWHSWPCSLLIYSSDSHLSSLLDTAMIFVMLLGLTRQTDNIQLYAGKFCKIYNQLIKLI